VARKAFTLIELLTVVAIMGAIATVGVISYTSSRSSSRVFAAVRDVMAMVRRARSIALVTQKPAMIIYSNEQTEDETMVKIEIKAEKLFSSNAPKKNVYTISGELVSSADEGEVSEEGGETIEDILSPESLSQEVAKSLKVKVLVGEEELVRQNEGARARSRISIFSTVDNVSRTYVSDEKKNADESGGTSAEEVLEVTDAPVKIVFTANGMVDNPHKIWIYPDGKSPEQGYCIEVDKFGEPKCVELE
jgi:prepilin-type N-terminal cleavage/methylation domain-containing protein